MTHMDDHDGKVRHLLEPNCAFKWGVTWVEMVDVGRATVPWRWWMLGKGPWMGMEGWVDGWLWYMGDVYLLHPSTGTGRRLVSGNQKFSTMLSTVIKFRLKWKKKKKVNPLVLKRRVATTEPKKVSKCETSLTLYSLKTFLLPPNQPASEPVGLSTSQSSSRPERTVRWSETKPGRSPLRLGWSSGLLYWRQSVQAASSAPFKSPSSCPSFQLGGVGHVLFG